uniref:Cardiomyopathy associated 5 n=1 Tax=Esox lucius TaxID=8010 RepID=A0AAY5KS78_ESOLU
MNMEEWESMEPEMALTDLEELQCELLEARAQDDEDEVEELQNSLREVVQDQSVKPKLQCLMVDPSFSMVTVQSEDSGIVWETASSRCSTPWASEASYSSDSYSMDGSATGGAQGKITIVFDEEKIVSRRKRTRGKSRLRDRLRRPGCSRSGSELGVERPEMTEVSVPNIRVESAESDTESGGGKDREQELFSLISEGYEILNIKVPSKLPTVDEEESTELKDNLSYLEETPRIRSKYRGGTEAVLRSAQDYPKLMEAPGGIEGEVVRVSQPLKPTDELGPCSRRDGLREIEYFEAFTLLEEVIVPGKQAPEILREEAHTMPQLEGHNVGQKTAADSLSATPNDDFVFVTDMEIASERLDEVFYGHKRHATAEDLMNEEENKEEMGKKGRKESLKSLKECGSALFGSEESILTPIFLSPGPPKIIDPGLLEEPTAMSFLYSDLYEDARGERRRSDEEGSEAGSLVSDTTLHGHLSDSEETDGYLEKFILKDETPYVECRSEEADNKKEGLMLWPERFELTGFLTRVDVDEEREGKVCKEEEVRAAEDLQPSRCEENGCESANKNHLELHCVFQEAVTNLSEVISKIPNETETAEPTTGFIHNLEAKVVKTAPQWPLAPSPSEEDNGKEVELMKRNEMESEDEWLFTHLRNFTEVELQTEATVTETEVHSETSEELEYVMIPHLVRIEKLVSETERQHICTGLESDLNRGQESEPKRDNESMEREGGLELEKEREAPKLEEKEKLERERERNKLEKGREDKLKQTQLDRAREMERLKERQEREERDRQERVIEIEKLEERQEKEREMQKLNEEKGRQERERQLELQRERDRMKEQEKKERQEREGQMELELVKEKERKRLKEESQHRESEREREMMGEKEEIRRHERERENERLEKERLGREREKQRLKEEKERQERERQLELVKERERKRLKGKEGEDTENERHGKEKERQKRECEREKLKELEERQEGGREKQRLNEEERGGQLELERERETERLKEREGREREKQRFNERQEMEQKGRQVRENEREKLEKRQEKERETQMLNEEDTQEKEEKKTLLELEREVERMEEKDRQASESAKEKLEKERHENEKEKQKVRQERVEMERQEREEMERQEREEMERQEREEMERQERVEMERQEREEKERREREEMERREREEMERREREEMERREREEMERREREEMERREREEMERRERVEIERREREEKERREREEKERREREEMESREREEMESREREEMESREREEMERREREEMERREREEMERGEREEMERREREEMERRERVEMERQEREEKERQERVEMERQEREEKERQEREENEKKGQEREQDKLETEREKHRLKEEKEKLEGQMELVKEKERKRLMEEKNREERERQLELEREKERMKEEKERQERENARKKLKEGKQEREEERMGGEREWERLEEKQESEREKHRLIEEEKERLERERQLGLVKEKERKGLMEERQEGKKQERESELELERQRERMREEKERNSAREKLKERQEREKESEIESERLEEKQGRERKKRRLMEDKDRLERERELEKQRLKVERQLMLGRERVRPRRQEVEEKKTLERQRMMELEGENVHGEKRKRRNQILKESENPIEADFEIFDEEEESQAKAVIAQLGMDWFCLGCGCLLSETDTLSGGHQDHEVTSVETAFEDIRERLSAWISELQERSEKIEDLVSELELAYNTVEDHCRNCEVGMEAQNEEIVALVMEQYNTMSLCIEDEKKAKLEQLYDQIISFQDSIDQAKVTLETTAREAELDPDQDTQTSKDIYMRLKKALQSAMSLELGSQGLLVFEDYAKGNTANKQTQRKGIPVPQKPSLQHQECGSANSTSVTVYWTVSSGDIIDCFQVYCMEDPQRAVSDEYRVTVKESYCVLEELEPDKVYKVWVMAVNYTGCSLPSERLPFRTSPSVPMIDTEQSTILWDSATLRWSATNQTQAESYNLEYCRQYALEGEGLRSISGILGRQQRVLLHPNENYLFYIKAVNKAGASEQSEAALISTRGTRFHLLKGSVHPILKLSEDKTTIYYPLATYKQRDEAANECLSVLGELLPMTGHHYWETIVTESPAYRVGVAYGTANRDSPLGENTMSWCLHCVPTPSSCRFELLHGNVLTDVFVVDVPSRIGTFLDFQNGRLSFYNAQSGQLLGTLPHCFMQPCHPVFGMEQPGSLKISMTLKVPDFTEYG